MSSSQPRTSKYSFSETPFPAAAIASCFQPIASLGDCFSRIRRAVEREEGLSIIVGGPGSGKSTICAALAGALGGSFRVVQLSDSQIDSSRSLLQSILFQLELPYRDVDEGEMRLSLIDHLRPTGDDPGMVLIVDEAQAFSVHVLEELRMISSIVRDGKPRVRTVLAGGPRLDENLSDPRLASFAQQIAGRCYLHPFTSDETSAYIAAQLGRVGGDAQAVITDGAIRRIHVATDGVPRLINQLMTHSLFISESNSNAAIRAEDVDAAWADLQQLPGTPVASSVAHAPSSPGSTSAVEFGPLDSAGLTETAIQSEPSESCGEACVEGPAGCIDGIGYDSEAEPSTIEPFETCVLIENAASDAAAGLSDVQVVGSDASADSFPTEVQIVGESEINEHAQSAESSDLIIGREYEAARSLSSDDSPGNCPQDAFRQFPVVKLAGEDDTVDAAQGDRSLEPQPNLAQEFGSGDELPRTPETACSQEAVLRLADAALASKLAETVDLINQATSPIIKTEILGIMDPENSNTIVPQGVQYTESDSVFGDGFIEELSIPLTNANVSEGAGRYNEYTGTGNDSPVVEQQLLGQVVSINREALELGSNISDHSATSTGGFEYGKITVSGDDRDLLVVEDSITDQPTVKFSPTPDQPDPSQQLAGLFSRIRQA